MLYQYLCLKKMICVNTIDYKFEVIQLNLNVRNG